MVVELSWTRGHVSQNGLTSYAVFSTFGNSLLNTDGGSPSSVTGSEFTQLFIFIHEYITLQLDSLLPSFVLSFSMHRACTRSYLRTILSIALDISRVDIHCPRSWWELGRTRVRSFSSKLSASHVKLYASKWGFYLNSFENNTKRMEHKFNLLYGAQ
jgi:hypothetical protein